MTLPTIDGPCDAAYVMAALARAGQVIDLADLERVPLTDGRSGARVTMLQAGTRSWVCKAIGQHSAGLRNFLGPDRCAEVELWAGGTLRDLPAPLSCPTLDIAVHAGAGEWWLLMEDVSAGIVPRGEFRADAARRLLTGVARLHARWWGRDAELAALPLPPLAASTARFADAVVVCGRGGAVTDRFTRFMIDEFVIGRFVPVFLDVLGPADADVYLAMIEDQARWLAALATLPATFTHGDLRRANIGFMDDRVSLFDWDLAAVAPAAVDLQWYWFLQFWAYPPPDGGSPADREPLREHYLAELEQARGSAIDRREFEQAWDLAWLRTLAVLGYCIVDPMTSPGAGPEVRAACTERARAAIAVARRVMDGL